MNQQVPVFASDMYPLPPDGALFAVRDWHRSARCTAGSDAIVTGCIWVVAGTPSDPLIKLDSGFGWPFGTHKMQLYTATILQRGNVTLLGELNKFVPLSSKRFGNVVTTPDKLTATVSGLAGEIVSATALRPHGASWMVVQTNVTIGPIGVGSLLL